jgi:hypothetical protein
MRIGDRLPFLGYVPHRSIMSHPPARYGVHPALGTAATAGIVERYRRFMSVPSTVTKQEGQQSAPLPTKPPLKSVKISSYLPALRSGEKILI